MLICVALILSGYFGLSTLSRSQSKTCNPTHDLLDPSLKNLPLIGLPASLAAGYCLLRLYDIRPLSNTVQFRSCLHDLRCRRLRLSSCSLFYHLLLCSLLEIPIPIPNQHSFRIRPMHADCKELVAFELSYSSGQAYTTIWGHRKSPKQTREGAGQYKSMQPCNFQNRESTRREAIADAYIRLTKLGISNFHRRTIHLA